MGTTRQITQARTISRLVCIFYKGQGNIRHHALEDSSLTDIAHLQTLLIRVGSLRYR